MKEPRNYRNTQAYTDYVSLEPGGYVCTVIKVEETTSSTDKPMIKIYLDICEGENKGFYAAQYKSDTRADRKWGCVVHQLTEDRDGNCNRGLKTFIEAVAASNKDFNPDTIWGDNFPRYFKNKYIGGLFRREEYENRNGDLKWSTKCFAFRDVYTIRAGVKTPEDKPLEKASAPSYSGYSEPSGFRDIEDDGELPF